MTVRKNRAESLGATNSELNYAGLNKTGTQVQKFSKYIQFQATGTISMKRVDR